MKKYLVNNNSENLIIFFTGWGCDEAEFEHLTSSSDVLILYDYLDLDLDFDFSKYKEINLIAFSAGVFIASIMNLDCRIKKRVAIDGNPFLFDEKFGLSTRIQELLYNITEENAEDFARNYLVKTDEEWKNFHPAKRDLNSCRVEFESLLNIYKNNKQNIKDIYDVALMGDEDLLFNVAAQKEFYGQRLKIIKNTRHNMFFKINKYEEII